MFYKILRNIIFVRKIVFCLAFILKHVKHYCNEFNIFYNMYRNNIFVKEIIL
jgi:hypothetical protein